MPCTIVDIAAALREHSPGVLPDFLDEVIINGDTEAKRHIAEAVLRDAMTANIAPHAVLIRCADAYRLDTLDRNRDKWFHFADHGGCTGAAFAAWKYARGIKL